MVHWWVLVHSSRPGQHKKETFQHVTLKMEGRGTQKKTHK
jgi:hypothetical protein